MRRVAVRILCAAVAMFAVAAAAAPALADDADPDDLEFDSGSNGADPGDFEFDSGPNDPWEGFNRKIFWFNEKADIYVMRPVAIGWDFIMPDLVQTALRNIFGNIRFPVIFVNDILQAKPIQASEDLGRFLVNTTVGIGGIWDPAKSIGLPGNNEDFGQTLGYWGVPPGPFLMLPLLGPSNPRDTVGLAADSATVPYGYFITWYISAAISATNIINTRARYIEEIDENRRTALDFYSFQRNAYVSYRENQVKDRAEDVEVPPDDDYYFEDFEEPGVEDPPRQDADEGDEDESK
jgi:phospholipid-binding lipoprotein MlaA